MRRILIIVLVVLSLVAAAGAASRPRHTRKAHRSRHHHVRRVIWNPVFRGSHELLVRENLQIDDLDLPRIADDDELALLVDSEDLVPLPDSRYLSVSVRLPNRNYCRPWTREFLEDMSAAYYEQFHKPLIITSLVRTAQQQKKLRRRNRNAAPEEGETVSTHLTGMTFDLYKRGMTRRQHKWIEAYMMPLKELGLIEPIEERRQPVFHVAVFDGYSAWRDSQNAPDQPDEAGRSVASSASN